MGGLYLTLGVLLVVINFAAGGSAAPESTAAEILGVLSPLPYACETEGCFNSLVKFEATNCTTGTTTQPCLWYKGLTYEFAVTLIPCKSTNTLRISAHFHPNSGTAVTVETTTVSGNFFAGYQYRVTKQVTVPQSLASGVGRANFYLADSSEGLIMDRCFIYSASD